MAKQKQFTDENGEEWEKVPKAVQDAADEYVSKMQAANRAVERKNIAKENCIAAMREAKVGRIRIMDGAKALVIESTDSLKTQKIKSAIGPDDGEE